VWPTRIVKRPFTYEEFWNPELAFERLGRNQALAIYVAEVEPLYVNDNLNGGLPKDWLWRKAYVYYRDGERCQVCGRFRPWVWDAHHVTHRGEGGNHAIENLILLCRKCHSDEHPDKC
jgi:HNH endonuclease